MGKIAGLIGLGVIALALLFDWWVWSSLITTGNALLLGSFAFFLFLAIFSIPLTIFLIAIGLLIAVSD